MVNADIIKQEFFKYYKKLPDIIVRAPGRVNLIGEHTDYNQGFVLPMAINRYIWIAGLRRDSELVHVYSHNFHESKTFPLGQTLQLSNANNQSWIGYVEGTAWALEQYGYPLSGAWLLIRGDVPIGAGLSSSAALEMATARMFMALANQNWTHKQIAQLGQKAENQWVHVNCGIMDQMISACGQKDHALLIDCRSLETQPIPMPRGLAIIIMDTMTRRDLVQSSYNNRSQECAECVNLLKISSLRDLSLEKFQTLTSTLSLPTHLKQRALHVITENERVLQVVQAMQKQDTIQFGKLCNESHESLRDHFEVCNSALDTMVQIARKQPGCYGARMTGAGFGGCAIALVDEKYATDFVTHVSETYYSTTNIMPKIYMCHAVDGAEIVA